MWQTGILILYLIHHAHTTSHSRCPALNRSVRCESYPKFDQCQTDTNCHGGKVCCPQKCGKECITPTLPIGNRPGCPVCLGTQAGTECPLCAHFQNLCNADTECKPGQVCCYNPSCGTWCNNKEPVNKPGQCPPNLPGLICPLFVRPGDCINDGSCPGKQKCCRQGCSSGCVDPEPRCGDRPPHTCAISCPFGYALDENNCPNFCKCNTGCAGNVLPKPFINCGSGQQTCPSRYQCTIPPEGGSGVCCPYECPQVKCSKPCPYGFVIDANGCQTCQCEPRCGAVCAISCPFGNVLDENNCPICECKTGCAGNVKPKPLTSCGAGQQRCPLQYQCNTPPLGGSGVCCPYECPQVKCSKPCPYGFVIDGNGCQTCECEPRCGPVCAIVCPFGNVMDANNCPTCACKTGCAGNVNPLPSVSCGSGQQRCPARYQCKTPSSGESGVCCPYECPLVKCSEPCPYGFVIDVNGCQTCRCKLKCGPVCAVICFFGNVLDEKGCPTCACKTGCAGNVKPLSSVKCGTGGQKCPSRYQCNSPPHGYPGVCCPYETKPTPDKCPRDTYPRSRCYVRRSCKNDSSCRGNKKCCKQGCQYKCVAPVY
ncbi:Hypothetical predicted protein [Mytilus galloprovincialis]|uniref:Uncharacterized protein n=1 Tax=Mytilus galloprovincialis TaxID=29158 RepID=A0A8B6EQN2_MYTGA|nr:Hypothetical predicted protein [Mytilus galloprovincialis]